MLGLLKKLFPKRKKTIADYCKPKHLDTTREELSPCGRYRLQIDSFKTGKGTWNYTRGTVFNTETGEKIATVHRNYSHFVFSWVQQEDKTYLLTGESYQGHTVVDCQTGEVRSGDTDFGWCMASHLPSEDGKVIAVEGCYWGGPYEWRLYDFSDPSTVPLKQIEFDGYLDHFEGKWLDNHTFVNREYGNFCLETGIEQYELPWKEEKRLRDLAKEIGEDKVWRKEVIGERFVRFQDGKWFFEETITIPEDDEEEDD